MSKLCINGTSTESILGVFHDIKINSIKNLKFSPYINNTFFILDKNFIKKLTIFWPSIKH